MLNAGDHQIASHFLGTAVLDHAPQPSSSIECREVIDGQQRLTTLQITLKSALDAITALRTEVTDEESRKNIDIAMRQLEPLIANPGYAEDEERYKVWPTNEDRAAFRDVMDADAAMGPAQTGSRMAKAYVFFRDQFSVWLKEGGSGMRARPLANSLMNHMKLIVLDLDDSDEPQAIFETLNAHGAPLLPADLIKNRLLWEATRQGLKVDQLYLSHWHEFDRNGDYWRAKVGTGHAARARLDLFLQHWLTRHVRKPVPLKHLYSMFRSFTAETDMRTENGNVDVEKLMRDIATNADLFREIENPAGKSRFDTFLRRLHVIDVSVFYPLILWVMGHSGSNADDRDKFGEALESYLVRRMVAGSQTRSYGTVALQLLDHVADLPPDEAAAPPIIAALTALEGSTVAWPDDDEFRTQWTRRRFYGQLRRNRLVMILRAIEERYQQQATKSEPVLQFNFDVLEVEHVMPKAWDAHWPLPAEASRDERNWAVDGIGNLTLVSSPLNKTLSNAPWIADGEGPSKRNALQAHSRLELNARLLATYREQWSEVAMKDRAKVLFEEASSIWPSANTFTAPSDLDEVR